MLQKNKSKRVAQNLLRNYISQDFLNMNKHVYTQEQLDAMSDFELNKAVAEKLGIYVSKDDDDFRGVIIKQINKIDKTKFIYDKADYLENYNDCMPIAEKYQISIHALSDSGWNSCNASGETFIGSTQPTIERAIVYCYLMMEV